MPETVRRAWFNKWYSRVWYIVVAGAVAMLLCASSPAFASCKELSRSLDPVFLGLLCIDVVVRFFVSDDRKNHWRRHWIDLFLVVPVLAAFYAIPAARVAIVVRRFVIWCTDLWRSERTLWFINRLGSRPAMLIVITFAGAILVGAFLLYLPLSSATGESIGFVNALFTSTSAVCVTGLIVLDTANDFSVAGQVIILCLIQIGALGIMTFSAILLLVSRGRMAKRYEAHMQGVLGHESLAGVQELVAFIFKMTMITELVGAVLLLITWIPSRGFSVETVCQAVFHSISAFCNAGFSLNSDSLEQWQSHVPTNLIMAALIITGGLGFIVVRDILRRGRDPATSRRGLSVQTKIVLFTSGALILCGMLALLVAEDPAPGEDGKGRLLNAFFQSVSARTAGFNTLEIGELTAASRWALIVLMFIGASPGSTGGGVKTTTLGVLLIWMKSAFLNRSAPEAFHRSISMAAVQRAVCIIGLGALLVTFFVFALSMTESDEVAGFDDICFEVTSAFGTVGLSTGITPQLSTAGRLWITMLMFVGRIGPLTLALAITGERTRIPYKYAEEAVLVG